MTIARIPPLTSRRGGLTDDSQYLCLPGTREPGMYRRSCTEFALSESLLDSPVVQRRYGPGSVAIRFPVRTVRRSRTSISEAHGLGPSARARVGLHALRARQYFV